VRDTTTLQSRLDELKEELADIDDRRAYIKGQIEKATANRWATGEYADPDWFRRANGAHRHLGVERAEVCREIGEVGRALRAANNEASRDLFRKAVHQIVGDATMDRIIERHRELTAEAGEPA